MARSLCELEWREDKEEGTGFTRRGGVRAAVSPKDGNGEGKGRSSIGVRAGIECRQGTRKKGKHTVHKDGERGMMPRPCENGVLVGPILTAPAGHAAIVTRRA